MPQEPEPIRVAMPGGDVIEFPAGTTPEQMNAALARFKEAPKEVSALSRFGSGLWKSIDPTGVVQLAKSMVTPRTEGAMRFLPPPLATQLEMIGGIAGQQAGQGRKMIENVRQGRYNEGAAHGLAAALPVVGPAAAAAGERIGEGDIAGGAGEATGLLGSVLLPHATAPVSRAVTGTAEKMYSGLLKPSKALRAEFPELVKGMIAKGRRITPSGLEAADEAITQSSAKAKGLLGTAPAPVKPIGYGDVAGELDEVEKAVQNRIAAGVAPESELDKITARREQLRKTLDAPMGPAPPPTGGASFAQTGSGPARYSVGRTTIDPVRGIDLDTAMTYKDVAQDAATGAYNQMRRGQIKQLGTEDLLDAATARGFRGATETRVPGLREANKQTQGLIGEARALEDALGRSGNHMPFGSVSDLAALGLGSVKPILGVAGKAATLPGPGSAIAIGLDRAGRIPFGELLRQALLQSMAQPEEEPPPD